MLTGTVNWNEVVRECISIMERRLSPALCLSTSAPSLIRYYDRPSARGGAFRTVKNVLIEYPVSPSYEFARWSLEGVPTSASGIRERGDVACSM